MEWSKAPRPELDNGRGIHWSPSTSRHGQGPDWENIWKPFLIESAMKWVIVLDDGGGSAEWIVKELIDLGVFPIVRMYRHPNYPSPPGGREIELIHRYRKLGVWYFITGNEPDLSIEWYKKKRPENWQEIVAENYIKTVDATRASGAIILHDPYGPGGVGRRNPFQIIKDMGRADIFNHMGIAAHNYGLGRGIDYPNDGIADLGIPYTQAEYDDFCVENWGPELDKNFDGEPWRWVWELSLEEVNKRVVEFAQPGLTIDDDQTCFRGFEAISNMFYDVAGFRCPLFITEGGWNVGQRAGTTFGDDGRYPKPTNRIVSKYTMEVFQEYPVPDYMFSMCYWFVAGYRMGVASAAYEPQGPTFTDWYNSLFNLNGELSLAQMLRDTPPRLRVPGKPPVEPPTPPHPGQHSLRIYIDNKLVSVFKGDSIPEVTTKPVSLNLTLGGKKVSRWQGSGIEIKR